MGVKAIVCDVNQTLFSLDAFCPKLKAAGLTQDNALELWFATVLRDGISISASGGFATFKDIASNAVKQLMAKAGSSQDSDKAAADIIKGFEEVQAYPDVLPGLQAIHNAGIKASTVIYVIYQDWISQESQQAVADITKGFDEVQAYPDVSIRLQANPRAGMKVCTMTNGSKGVTQKFLDRSKLDFVSPVLDVEGPRCWKPCRAAYQYVLTELGLQPEEVMLVAVHPWDCNGAKAAGLKAAFIARKGENYPDFFTAPDYSAKCLEDLAQQLRA